MPLPTTQLFTKAGVERVGDLRFMEAADGTLYAVSEELAEDREAVRVDAQAGTVEVVSEDDLGNISLTELRDSAASDGITLD